MADHSVEIPSLPSSKSIGRGIKAFILFSIAGILWGLWWRSPANFDAIWHNLHWKFVALLAPLVCLDYLLGGLRYRLFFDGKILPHVSLWDCMRSNWANIFMGAATPFQSGGGLAQLYVLWRCGARISDGLLISLVNFIATLFFFLISTTVALFLSRAELFGKNFAPIMQAGFIIIGCVFGFAIVVLAFPHIGLLMVKQLFRLIPIRNLKFVAFRDKTLSTLEAEIDHFQNGLRQVLRYKKGALFTTILATLSLYSNKYVMGYAIALALGLDVPFDSFLYLQIIQLFLIYYAPTPGAAGIAEVSSLWLMEKVMPRSVLLLYAVSWRLVTTICGAVIGGVVLSLDTRNGAQRSRKPYSREISKVPCSISTDESRNNNRIREDETEG